MFYFCNMSLPAPSKLTNKKYIILAIIGSIILISTIASIRFSDFDVDELPEGVGEIGSEHAHAKFSVMLDSDFIDFDPITYDKYANANKYMFMMPDGSYNVIHRHAANVTLGMFFDSFGIKWTDDCLVFSPDTVKTQGKPFERLEYCNEGDEKTRLFVGGDLNEMGPNYIIQEGEQILIVFDDRVKTQRNYKIG